MAANIRLVSADFSRISDSLIVHALQIKERVAQKQAKRGTSALTKQDAAALKRADLLIDLRERLGMEWNRAHEGDDRGMPGVANGDM